MRSVSRLVVGVVLALVTVPLVSGAARTVDVRPPADVLDFFERRAAAAYGEMSVGLTSDGQGDGATADARDGAVVTFGSPRTVHRFTRAFTHGDATGVIAEPDGTWVAPAFEDGVPSAVVLVWRPPGSRTPEIASVEGSPERAAQLAGAPDAPLVVDAPRGAWFTWHGDRLEGLDGSRVGADVLAGRLASEPPPGGSDVFVPGLVLFQPQGIATVIAVVLALVGAGVLLRRRRATSRRPDDVPSSDR